MFRFLLAAGFLVLAATHQSLLAGDKMEVAPDGWKFVTVRPETACIDSVSASGAAPGLIITGNGEKFCDGRWVKRIDVPASQYVRFSVRYRPANIDSLVRCVVAAIVWLDESGKPLPNSDFAPTNISPDAQGWQQVNAVFPVPPKAKQAQMELRLRWSTNGKVEWRDAKIEAAATPESRKVHIASVNHRPRATKSIQENLEQFAKWIDEAGAQKADIVCLPEGITVVGRGSDYLGAAEPIPGPSTEFLGRCAAKNHAYIVAGLYELDGKAAYNTAVLIGRDGKLIGKYRKICLPQGEYDGGLAPGSEYPIFETDFGKIGMMICWDVSYPEVAREFASRGAEILFMPIWGGNETLCRARAIENQIPLVISSYDLRSAIYDAAGEPVAQAKDASSCVVVADLDLSETMNWKWSGRWRDRIWIEGPPPRPSKS